MILTRKKYEKSAWDLSRVSTSLQGYFGVRRSVSCPFGAFHGRVWLGKVHVHLCSRLSKRLKTAKGNISQNWLERLENEIIYVHHPS